MNIEILTTETSFSPPAEMKTQAADNKDRKGIKKPIDIHREPKEPRRQY